LFFLCSNPPLPEDTDGDGLVDVCDNCPTDSNPDQRDTSANGQGDVCNDEDLGIGILTGLFSSADK